MDVPPAPTADDLRHLAAELAAAQQLVDQLTGRRAAMIRHLRHQGMKPTVVARLARITRQRVDQIAPRV